MLTRRQYLKLSALLGAACATPGGLLQALESSRLIRREIPKTGETLPVIGLGSSATFRTAADREQVSALKAVIETLLEHGGTVIDTAPSYGDAEEICGEIARGLKASDDVFWASKVNVASRGSNHADAGEARAQIDRSLMRLGKKPVDLIQVHNLAALPAQVPVVESYKDAGKIRYIGTTSTQTSAYGDLEQAMHDYPLDFIGVDYAIDNRIAAERILPLAADLGIAVLIYAPFGRTRLWSRVKGQPVPEWAAEIGIDSWGKFFLKYVAAHPAVTCVTPATSRAENMLDNIGAAYGDLPDAAMRKRMQATVEALPTA